MEQNIVVSMIDEELERLQQVRDILHSLLPAARTLHPLLKRAVREETARIGEATDTGSAAVESVEVGPTETKATEAMEAEVTHSSPRKSRRGIRTGPRGPRLRGSAVPPRALDSKVPSAPVVVKPGSLHLVAAPPKPVVAKTVPTHKLDSLLAAAFATIQ